MGVVEVSLTPVVNLPQMHVESVNPKSYESWRVWSCIPTLEVK